MHEVAVVLSTYNGSRYIIEQLDSILRQKDVHATVFIRDDGSDDNTVELIKSTYIGNPDIKLTEGENIGVGNSFMECLYSIDVSCDYFCFSDQDDIWEEDKIISAIGKIKDKTVPCLYTSNQYLADSSGVKTGIRYIETPKLTYGNNLCSNRLSGCTFVWNTALQDILTDIKRRPDKGFLNIRIHDVWVVLAAFIAGEVIYDETPHILYRIHEKNYVGINEKNGIAGKIKNTISNIKSGKMTYRSRTCEELVKRFGDLMSDEVLKNTKMYADYLNDPRIKREVLKGTPYFLADNESVLSSKIKLCFNLW